MSLALGAFFAGMILSESALSQRAAQESLPLRDAFAVLFFVSVGMLFNPATILADPWPLIATLLLDNLRRHVSSARVKAFAFRAMSPLFDIHRFTVCGREEAGARHALWARNHEGALAMEATAELA